MTRPIEPSRPSSNRPVRQQAVRGGAACAGLALRAAAPWIVYGLVALAWTAALQAQADSTGGAAEGIPEPIYWKQDLFLIPYQWNSAAEPAAAQVVRLFVSKDQGAIWRQVSEAQPHVKAFTYRAEGEGEYWFAIRTIDNQGRELPAGPHRPELRVIVDTTMPRIDMLRAGWLADGSIEIVWRASDQHLDIDTWQIEAQFDAETWRPISPASLTHSVPPIATATPAGGVHAGRAIWQTPPGARPLAIRASVADRAGNSATYQTPIQVEATADLDQQLQTNAAQPPGSAAVAAPGASAFGAWQPLPADQTWTAETSRAPFRLSGSAKTPDDGVTAFGEPPGASGENAPHRVSAPPFQPLEPFRQAAIRRLPAPAPAASATMLNAVGQQAIEPLRQDVGRRQAVDVKRPVLSERRSPAESHAPPTTRPPLQIPSGVQPKWVGSRTFALEYDLDDVGHWGISHVELWGTSDGGTTWHQFARDDALSGPLVATVDDEGLYGFRIVVAGTQAPPQTPRSGDEPELWVAVDLSRPVVEITEIERGEGNQADHLIVRWRAVDDNLRERPIALLYSSRPAGPWSAIAMHLENTGQYAWRVERHVPERFYLRIEARDQAGNLAAYQTREPLAFAAMQPSIRLRGVEAVGPTANSASNRPH